MSTWADDPELVATFRAEVEERLASLSAGLMQLEGHGAPKQLVAALFRDAHTVKGSARMLALDGVVELAHRAEDLLGALRDGRVVVRKDLVDLLLVTVEAISRSLPGAERKIGTESLDQVTTALDQALAGVTLVEIPRLLENGDADNDAEGEELLHASRGGEHVRVPTRRVHGLLNVVGEAELDVRRVDLHALDALGLVAEQARLVRVVRSMMLESESTTAEVTDAVTALVGVNDRLAATVRDLRGRTEEASVRLARVRDGAMSLAMVPVRRVVAAFPALVREVATAVGRDVELHMSGTELELDVRVLDGVADALRHLVTNAVDHGIEAAAVREAAGKPARGRVDVTARNSGAAVVIEVADDGGGIDTVALRARAIESGLLDADTPVTDEIVHRVLFEPGFTSRKAVTSTSGRGVGLDVVRTQVESLGGIVEVDSELGRGTRFTLTVPVTLGVMRCLLVRCGAERYAIPLNGIVETIGIDDAVIHEVAGTRVLIRDDQSVPVAQLAATLGVVGSAAPRVLIVSRFGREGQLAWAVDSVDSENEVVVKDLGGFLGRVSGTAGATIDSDGSIVLLIDLRDLIGSTTPLRGASQTSSHGSRAALSAERADSQDVDSELGGSVATMERTTSMRPRVLVVEDSVGVRELQRSILEGAGYDVTTAIDGTDGAARLQQEPVDLVLSDVEMPGMDGFTLTRTLRATRGWENVPVVIMTSRGDDVDKRAGMDAGADAYLLKSEFDQHVLIDTVRRLVGR